MIRKRLSGDWWNHAEMRDFIIINKKPIRFELQNDIDLIRIDEKREIYEIKNKMRSIILILWFPSSSSNLDRFYFRIQKLDLLILKKS